MENTKYTSHAKKCKSKTTRPNPDYLRVEHPNPVEPIWGKQGEWSMFKQYSPLPIGAGCGYKEKEENWEDVYVTSELQHAEDAKTWADRIVLLERAYKSKHRKLEVEYEEALTHGFEEAYECLREYQKTSEEKGECIIELEEKLKMANEQIASYRKVIEECCPEKMVTFCIGCYPGGRADNLRRDDLAGA